MATETIETIATQPEYLQPHIEQNLANVGGVWDPATGQLSGGLIYQEDPEYVDENGDPIPRLAEFNQDQLAAHELGREGIGVYEDNLNISNEALGQGLGTFDDAAVTDLQSQVAAGTDYSIDEQYLNPYTQEVIDTTLADLDKEQSKALIEVGDQAADVGAFGGSRQGVLEAETYGEFDANKTAAVAELNAANFDQAQEAQESHANRELQGAELNTNILNTAAESQYQGSELSGLIGGLEQTYNINDVSTLGAIGDQQQQQEQMGLDIMREDYEYDRDRPFELAGFYNDMINGVPSTQSSITENTSDDPSALAQGLGALGTLATAGNTFGWWGGE
jgi:hypothetical protein